jgi:3-methylfumaryl-CoA hydratase
LRIGETVEKRSCIEQVDCKQGKSGPLVLVEVSHQYTVAGHLRITEQQTLAFTNAQRQTNTVPPAKDLARPYDWQRCIAVDPVMLFRYSALTFNSHRIHYDRDYAVQDEAYPGLLVQAPLGATLLFELLRAHAPDRVVRSFTFRAVRPLFDRQSFMLRGICEKDGSISLWVADSAGQLAVQANAFVVAA